MDAKRRRHYKQHSAHTRPPLTFSQSKISPGEILFQILSPVSKTGGVIGKGGSIIQQLRDQTGAKIHVEDPVHGCDEQTIAIVGSVSKKETVVSSTMPSDKDEAGDMLHSVSLFCENGSSECSPAQAALMRVFEKIFEGEKGEEGKGEGFAQGVVICRLLVGENQVGIVLGRGGKNVDRIRQESGAQIKVFDREHVPLCAAPGDQLIKIIGSFIAAGKALFSVSNLLQENHDNSSSTRHSVTGFPGNGMFAQVESYSEDDYRSSFQSCGYQLSCVRGPDIIGPGPMGRVEDEIVFKLLCRTEKVPSLIGKGGSVVRAMENETGACIKVVDIPNNTEERVVVISAIENSEQTYSPAIDAVGHVFFQMGRLGFEPDVGGIVRILVQPQAVGFLFGKGGSFISDIQRGTGTIIHIFSREESLNRGLHHNEIVQVVGNFQAVRDALFQITSRLREIIFPEMRHFQNTHRLLTVPPFQEISPSFRPHHDPLAHAYPSSIGYNNNIKPDTDCVIPFRPSYGHTSNLMPSQPFWHSEVQKSGNSLGVSNIFGNVSTEYSSGNQCPVENISVEIVVPEPMLGHVYGENGNNLNQIKLISGATVTVRNHEPGSSEGRVMVFGSLDQTHVAQSLLHAFVLSGIQSTS